ncbi:MAG: guanylate kinase [Proteobacteria bacterium]|nr:guanylate kinase [Pseudomonadota bacterium]
MQRQLIRKGILFVLMGPTGSGKSTFCGRLIKENPETMQYSISATTRAPRASEVQGKSYHFMSREEFIERRTKGEFFEWEENHGNLYGTLRASLEDGINAGKDLLFQIDIRGALNFKQNFPQNTVTIFIIPPTFADLQKRLQGRGTVDPLELERRFATAKGEYGALLSLGGDTGKIDYLVVNNELDQTYEAIYSIVLAERSRYHRMERSSVEQFCDISA